MGATRLSAAVLEQPIAIRPSTAVGADLAILNAQIWSMNPKQLRAQADLVRADRMLVVGSISGVRRHRQRVGIDGMADLEPLKWPVSQRDTRLLLLPLSPPIHTSPLWRGSHDRASTARVGFVEKSVNTPMSQMSIPS